MEFTQPDLFDEMPPRDKWHRRPLTAEERDRVVELYQDGVSLKDICAVVGCSTCAIYSALTRAGIELRVASRGRLHALCEVCNEPVRYVAPSLRAKGLGRFCSQACMGEAKRLPPELRGVPGGDLSCTRCSEVKPVADFYEHAKSARGYQYWCKTCCAEVRTERAKVPVDPNVRRRHALWSMYRFTVAQYDAMYEQQGARCAICGDPKDSWEPGVGIAGRDRFLVVDHCHANGHVRGLLCGNCNHGLGKFKDDVARLLAAAEYLRRDAARREVSPAAA